jgi:hypothetical protein
LPFFTGLQPVSVGVVWFGWTNSSTPHSEVFRRKRKMYKHKKKEIVNSNLVMAGDVYNSQKFGQTQLKMAFKMC